MTETYKLELPISTNGKCPHCGEFDVNKDFDEGFTVEVREDENGKVVFDIILCWMCGNVFILKGREYGE